MRNKVMVVSLLIFVILVLASPIIIANTQEEIKVKVNVHVSKIQEMEIIEPVAVNVRFPWSGLKEGRPLIIKNVGLVQIKSNTSWALNGDSSVSNELKVFIRPAHRPGARWQHVADNFMVTNGENGKFNLSWDLKIEYTGNFRESFSPQQKQVQLGFVMAQLF